MIPMTHAREIIVDAPLPVEAVSPTLPTEATFLGGDKPYVVCAFYTPNYLDVVRHLKESLDRFQLSYHIECVQSRGSWEASTRIKPVFIAKCLERFPDHDILYLDADAVVSQHPSFFDDVTTDVALFFAPVVKNGKHLLSIAAGTVYVRNTPGGRKFANLWKNEERNTTPLNVDEDMIYMAFPKFEGISFTALPRTYYKIFDADGPEPVIEHFQASRGQFKLSRLLRKGRRALLVIAAILSFALTTIIWWQFL